SIGMTCVGQYDVKGNVALSKGGTLFLGAASIAVGESATSNAALVLGSQWDNTLRGLGSLALRADSALSLMGAVQLGSADLRQLTLDAPVIAHQAGTGGSASSIAAGEVRLQNSGAGLGTPGQGTADTLAVQADVVRLAAGDQLVTGFSAISITGARAIV